MAAISIGQSDHPWDIANGGPGGKIEVARAYSPFALPIFSQPFCALGIFVSLKSVRKN